jgi:hypothetical protein
MDQDLDPYWKQISIHPRMLDPDPDEINTNQQPCSKHFLKCKQQKGKFCVPTKFNQEKQLCNTMRIETITISVKIHLNIAKT